MVVLSNGFFQLFRAVSSRCKIIKHLASFTGIKSTKQEWVSDKGKQWLGSDKNCFASTKFPSVPAPANWMWCLETWSSWGMGEVWWATGMGWRIHWKALKTSRQWMSNPSDGPVGQGHPTPAIIWSSSQSFRPMPITQPRISYTQ